MTNRDKSAPFNFGYVASEVVIYPPAASAYPLKSRNRQFNEMFFNEVTIKNMNAISGNENLEMVSDGIAGSTYGVTLSPKFSFVDTNLNINLNKTEWSESQGSESILATSGAAISDLTAKYWHNSWMPTNSIFTSSAQDPKSGQIAWSNIPEYYYGANEKTIIKDKPVINNFLNSLNPKFLIFPKKIVSPNPEKENSSELDVSFIGNSNTYNGDFIKNIPEEILNTVSSSDQVVDSQKQFPGAKDGDKFRIIKNIPPGVHCGLRKQFENFHGQDFVYTFEKLSFDHALPNNSVKDGVNFYFNLSGEHAAIDPVGILGSELLSLDGTDVGKNYGISNIYDSKSKTWSNNGFYLGNQPYIVLELPNQSPNTINEYDNLYIIVPKNGNVIAVNCSKKIRQLTIPSQEDPDIFVKYIVKPSFRMSKIIYDFGFSGSELLSQQNFSIKIQHLMGSLQISFSGGRSYIVSEESYNANTLSEDVFLQGTEDGSLLIEIDQENESSFIPEKDGIMLHGRPRIFWGNSQYAVNASPIEYHSEAIIKPNYPIPILGRFGSTETDDGNGGKIDDGGQAEAKKNLFLLLRNRIDPSSHDDGFLDERITSHFEDLRKFVFKNQSLIYGEIFEGELVETDSVIMPARFSNYVPGCCLGRNDPISGSGISRFKYDYFDSLSSNAKASGGIKISQSEVKKRGINSESNLDNFSFGTFVQFTLNSGPIGLLHPFFPNKDKYFGSFIRPVMFGYSSLVKEDNSPAVSVSPKNIANLVHTYRDSWTREGNSFIRHTASLTLYIPKDLSMRDLVSGRRVNSSASRTTRFGESVEFSSDVRKFIMSLQDKAFYIRVYLGRFLNNTEDDDSSYVYDIFHPDFDGGCTNLIGGQSSSSEFKYLAFTGICNQVNFTMKPSHIEVSMELEDYCRILEDTKFLNPPFYDAVRDYDAIYDVLSCAGLREGSGTSNGFLPMDFMKYMVSQDVKSADRKYMNFNDRTVVYANYVLPGNYDPLNNPKFKPNFGDDYLSFIKYIANISGKTFYFDNAGIARFEISPDEIEYFSNNNSTSSGASSDSQSSADPPIKFQHIDPQNEIHDFYTSVDYNKFADTGKFRIWNVIVTDSFQFNKKVSDIFNEIRVVTTTPDMKLLLAGHLNVNSIYDPSSPGFLGYRKMFLQKDGVFGSKVALQKIVNRYTMFFNPPLFCSFSVPGRNGVMPNQYFRLHYGSSFKRGEDGKVETEDNGNPVIEPLFILGIITEVSSEIDKKTNRWSTRISGRYMYTGETIDFSSGEDTTLSVTT